MTSVSKANYFFLIAFLVCANGDAGADDQAKVLQPSDLQPPCTVVKGKLLTDDWVSGWLILADRNGNKIGFSDGEEGDYFFRENGIGITKAKSKAGSPEEQILLKLLKDWYAKFDDPALDSKKAGFGPNEKDIERRYWDQTEVKHFIRLLEFRCTTKREHPEL